MEALKTSLVSVGVAITALMVPYMEAIMAVLVWVAAVLTAPMVIYLSFSSNWLVGSGEARYFGGTCSGSNEIFQTSVGLVGIEWYAVNSEAGVETCSPISYSTGLTSPTWGDWTPWGPPATVILIMMYLALMLCGVVIALLLIRVWKREQDCSRLTVAAKFCTGVTFLSGMVVLLPMCLFWTTQPQTYWWSTGTDYIIVYPIHLGMAWWGMGFPNAIWLLVFIILLLMKGRETNSVPCGEEDSDQVKGELVPLCASTT